MNKNLRRDLFLLTFYLFRQIFNAMRIKIKMHFCSTLFYQFIIDSIF